MLSASNDLCFKCYSCPDCHGSPYLGGEAAFGEAEVIGVCVKGLGDERIRRARVLPLTGMGDLASSGS